MPPPPRNESNGVLVVTLRYPALEDLHGIRDLVVLIPVTMEVIATVGAFQHIAPPKEQ